MELTILAAHLEVAAILQGDARAQVLGDKKGRGGIADRIRAVGRSTPPGLDALAELLEAAANAARVHGGSTAQFLTLARRIAD